MFFQRLKPLPESEDSTALRFYNARNIGASGRLGIKWLLISRDTSKTWTGFLTDIYLFSIFYHAQFCSRTVFCWRGSSDKSGSNRSRLYWCVHWKLILQNLPILSYQVSLLAFGLFFLLSVLKRSPSLRPNLSLVSDKGFRTWILRSMTAMQG